MSSSVPTSTSTTEDNQLQMTPSSSVLSEESARASPAHHSFCLSALEDCLSTGRFADAAIKCQQYVFDAHSIVLYGSGSAYLQGLLKAAYLDDKGRLIIELNDAEVAVVARMLIWLYTGRYSVAQLAETFPVFSDVVEPQIEDLGEDAFYWEEELREQTLHLLIYAAAKKFGLPSLQEEAFHGFCRSLKGVDGIVNNFEAATIHTQKLVKIVYAETSGDDRDVRDIVLKQLQYELHNRQLELYFHDPDLAEKGVLKLITEIPALAVEMASSSLTLEPGECSTCHDDYPIGCPALVRPCSCGELYGCTNTECVEQRMKPQYCSYCSEPTLSPPMVAEPAAQHPHSVNQQAQNTTGWGIWGSRLFQNLAI